VVRSAKDWSWSSYRAIAGLVEESVWLQVAWLLAAFSKKKKTATLKYREFVSSGKNQPKPWEELKNQIYLGSDKFVDDMQCKISPETNLSEIPSSQKRKVPNTIQYYENTCRDRDEVIVLAYASGGYSMKEIGDHFSLNERGQVLPCAMLV